MLRSKVVLCLCLLLGMTCAATGHTDDLGLTPAEQRWLNDHPLIRIAPDPDFPPFEWLTNGDEYHGIAAEYMHIIEKKLGVKFKVVPTSSWSQVLALLQQREADVQPALASTKQRQEYMLFTRPYTSFPGVVVSSQKYKNIKQLSGREVVVVQGNYWDDVLAMSKPDVTVQRVDNTTFGIESTAMGTVDAMITDLASATTAIKKAGITNLYVVNDPDNRLGRLEHAIAVRSDWPELRSILNKVLASLSQQEHDAILSSWINFEEPVFWQQRQFWYLVLVTLAVILMLFTGFFVWNRMLTTRVKQRTIELQAAQTRLIQAEKMESIGRLAAGVAHEVKNPLAIIQMGADYLAQELPKDQTTAEVIHDIDDAVRRADTVIHGLLDFSRDKKLILKPGGINEVISSALHLVDHELRQRKITVELFLAEDLPKMALDQNRLQQVFINLIMNAAHAMERNGTLLIGSELKTVCSAADFARDREGILSLGQRVIQVEVADTGPGIREQDKAMIFDLFYTTKDVGEGTGLGLSVSHNIVSLHGGSIDIANRSEGGASVMMFFKLNEGDDL